MLDRLIYAVWFNVQFAKFEYTNDARSISQMVISKYVSFFSFYLISFVLRNWQKYYALCTPTVGFANRARHTNGTRFFSSAKWLYKKCLKNLWNHPKRVIAQFGKVIKTIEEAKNCRCCRSHTIRGRQFLRIRMRVALKRIPHIIQWNTFPTNYIFVNFNLDGDVDVVCARAPPLTMTFRLPTSSKIVI